MDQRTLRRASRAYILPTGVDASHSRRLDASRRVLFPDFTDANGEPDKMMPFAPWKKSSCYFFAACIAGLWWSAALSAKEPASLTLDSFETIYEAKLYVVTGVVRVGVRRQPEGGYVYEYSVETHSFWDYFFPGVLNEITLFDYHEGRPRPSEYELRNTMGSKARNGNYRFDWTDNEITGHYKGDKIRVPIKPGTVDRALLQLVLQRDIKNNTLKDEYLVFDRDEVISVDATIIGNEKVDLLYGTYNTVVVQHSGTDDSEVTTLWFAPLLDHLLVKVEQKRDGRQFFHAELRQLMITF
jgi:hypothetical protein